MQVVDDATLSQRLKSGDFKIALVSVDGTDNVDLFNGVDNTLQYQNGAAQQEYQQAVTSTNATDYATHMAMFARTVSQDAAAAWLYERGINIAVNPKLSGYPVNLTDEILPLEDLALKKH